MIIKTIELTGHDNNTGTYCVLSGEDGTSLSVWTQYAWNDQREKFMDSQGYFEYPCLFNMPPAGSAIFRINDHYNVIIAHDRLDNIDLRVAVSMYNALGGHGVEYVLRTD